MAARLNLRNDGPDERVDNIAEAAALKREQPKLRKKFSRPLRDLAMSETNRGRRRA
jgi:hypothetical protein